MEKLESANGRTPIEVAQDVALKGGVILLERFHHVKEISYKGRGNVVTDVDKEVETEILGALSAEFPDVGLLGEESASIKGPTPATCG